MNPLNPLARLFRVVLTPVVPLTLSTLLALEGVACSMPSAANVPPRTTNIKEPSPALDVGSDGVAAEDSTAAPSAPVPRPPRVFRRVLADGGFPFADVTPGRPAAPGLSAGTVYLTALRAHAGELRTPWIAEWDVAGGQILREAFLPSRAGELPASMRVASSPRADRVHVVVEAGFSSPIRLATFDASLHVVSDKQIGMGSDASIECTERHLAVSFRDSDDPLRRLRVQLFDAAGTRVLASTTVGATETMTGMVRVDALAFIGDRLIVLGTPPLRHAPKAVSPTGEVALPDAALFALSLPSLKVVGSLQTDLSGHARGTLAAAGGQIFLASNLVMHEFTKDLAIVGQREAAADVAVTPAGKAFDAERARDTLASAVPVETTCLPAWSGSEPIATCVSDENVYFVRLNELR